MIWLDRNMPGRPAEETTGLELAKALGSAEESATLAEMRATTATEVLANYLKTPGARGRAMVDGWVFSNDIQAIFEQGRQNRVPPIPQSEELLSYHGAEIVYVIGNFHLASFVPTTEDEALTDAMSSYWVNFATTGYPNGAGLPEWPAYDSGTEAFMEFGDLVHQGAHLLERESDFFEHFNAVERAKN